MENSKKWRLVDVGAFVAYCVAMTSFIYVSGASALQNAFMPARGTFNLTQQYFDEWVLVGAAAMAVLIAVMLIQAVVQAGMDVIERGKWAEAGRQLLEDVLIIVPSAVAALFHGSAFALSTVANYMAGESELFTIQPMQYLDTNTVQITLIVVMWMVLVYAVANASLLGIYNVLGDAVDWAVARWNRVEEVAAEASS
jgi:hypothetical protein